MGGGRGRCVLHFFLFIFFFFVGTGHGSSSKQHPRIDQGVSHIGDDNLEGVPSTLWDVSPRRKEGGESIGLNGRIGNRPRRLVVGEEVFGMLVTIDSVDGDFVVGIDGKACNVVHVIVVLIVSIQEEGESIMIGRIGRKGEEAVLVVFVRAEEVIEGDLRRDEMGIGAPELEFDDAGVVGWNGWRSVRAIGRLEDPLGQIDVPRGVVRGGLKGGVVVAKVTRVSRAEDDAVVGQEGGHRGVLLLEALPAGVAGGFDVFELNGVVVWLLENVGDLLGGRDGFEVHWWMKECECVSKKVRGKKIKECMIYNFTYCKREFLEFPIVRMERNESCKECQW